MMPGEQCTAASKGVYPLGHFLQRFPFLYFLQHFFFFMLAASRQHPQEVSRQGAEASRPMRSASSACWRSFIV